MAQVYDIAESFLNPLEKTPHRCGAGSFHDFPRRSDLLARSREIRCLRVMAGAVLDNQLPRLYSVSVGPKVTLIVHFALAFKLAAHVVAETAKCPVAPHAGH